MAATVRDIIRKKGNEAVKVLQDVPVYEALRLMKEREIGALIVIDTTGNTVGIVSDRDCTQRIIPKNDRPKVQPSQRS